MCTRHSVLVAVAVTAASFSVTAYASEWSGLYVGAQGSANFAHARFALPGDTHDKLLDNNSDQTSFVGGGLAGYNFQFGNKVVGVEADITTGPDSQSVTSCTVPDGCYTPAHESYTTVNNLHLGGSERLRVRFGTIAHDTLFYGAVGYSHTNARLTLDGYCYNAAHPTVPDIYNFQRSKSPSGFNVGIGAEHFIRKNLFVRAEYLYEDFGTETFRGEAPEWNDRRIALYDNQLRLAVGLRF